MKSSLLMIFSKNFKILRKILELYACFQKLRILFFEENFIEKYVIF